jgi:phosphoribosylformimino-5-aminoimidazole carboxamide ribotide isomerase
MQILPVLDVLHGQVVRGVGGRREEYRPIVSSLVAGSEPLTVAAALRELCGTAGLYLADLDAILHRRPQIDLYRKLAAAGPLLVDAGVRSVAEAQAVAETGTAVIAGLETVPEAATLREMVAAVGSDRVVFSLDLQAGRTLGGAGWPMEPLEIVEQVADCGVSRLIVLDLADVGSDTGGSTLDLCRQIQRRWPDVRLIVGGGVRGRDDLDRWSQLGVEAVLVASALHDGRLTAADLV